MVKKGSPKGRSFYKIASHHFNGINVEFKESRVTGGVMFLIRLIFWVTVVAIFLPPDLREEIFSFETQTHEVGHADESQYSSSSFDPAGADRLVPYIVETATTFCERQQMVCQLGDAALIWAHEQAVVLSGHLHLWLQETLEARQDIKARPV